ncbi:hypothetical protein JNB50_12415 [Leifsonia sp. TF02-11]|nr:hypothetical protein [Leifsonia sp. TF02-11]MBO1739518.1 hypothetical protein [Leifsonia sp. TF02-11]
MDVELVEVGVHKLPAPGFDGVVARGARGRGARPLDDARVELRLDRLDDVLLRGEVEEDRAFGHAGAFRDRLDARARHARVDEQRPGGVQHRRLSLLRRAPPEGRCVLGHAAILPWREAQLAKRSM